ncbi:MAG: hypothetical protein SGJ27_07370, partial [Candidatus Melainabacteria bacterium]|nr:hypothetical protein [Candidatus Melainabacteria bacterium]
LPPQYEFSPETEHTFLQRSDYQVVPSEVAESLVLMAVRALLGWLIAPLGGTVLGAIYDFCWARFEFVWEAFLVVAKWFSTWILMPIVNIVLAFFKAIADVWGSITGRK